MQFRRAGRWAVGVACLLTELAPVGATADTGPSTTVAPTTTVTVAAQNETKILTITPPPTTAPSPVPAPVATKAPTTTVAPAPVETAASVSADSPALRALVGVTTADQRQRAEELAQSQAAVDALRAAFDAAQADLTARQSDEQAAQAGVDRAQADLAAAESRLTAARLAATSAAEAVDTQRTPVASPPSKGHAPSDAVVQARRDLVAATVERDTAHAAVDDAQGALDTARQASTAAGQALTARADDLQRGLDGLARVTGTDGSTPGGAAGLRPAPTALATATIPAEELDLYGRAAATCPGLSWLVLAGIGAVESAHGTSTAPGVHIGANFAGAMGPMQFLAGTWAAYGVDGDGDGVRNVYDPADAIFGAANYLCASGGGDVSTLRRALWTYNHADWYVEQVLQLAARY